MSQAGSFLCAGSAGDFQRSISHPTGLTWKRRFWIFLFSSTQIYDLLPARHPAHSSWDQAHLDLGSPGEQSLAPILLIWKIQVSSQSNTPAMGSLTIAINIHLTINHKNTIQALTERNKTKTFSSLNIVWGSM